jgi:hypothetical protein
VKRWIVRATLCLILGAITTVAVAWTCAAGSRLRTRHYEEAPALTGNLANLWPHDYPWHFLGLEKSRGIGIQHSRLSAGSGIGWMALRLDAGFPCLAMTGRCHMTTRDYVVHWTGLWNPPTTLLGDVHLALPLEPIGPGFAIDTLFYAAIWGGVLFGFASAKRAIRRRRGRCPMCGYDLRGAPGLAAGCSECGWNRMQAAKDSSP